MTKAIKDSVYKDCPIRSVLARVCDKWSLLVMYSLKGRNGKPLRFGELRKSIPDISQKMLTTTLRTLECDGYVSRHVFAEVPPRVEYTLTERGVSLLPHVDALIGWATNNIAGILRDRESNLL